MIEVLILIGLVTFVGFLMFNFAVDTAWLTGKILEPLVRIFQKTILGIDEPTVGSESMIGRLVPLEGSSRASVRSGERDCYVLVDGERWRAQFIGATAEDYSRQESNVRIIGRDGLVLRVERATNAE